MMDIRVLQSDGFMIKYITNPNFEEQLASVTYSRRCLEYIDNPAEEVIILALQKGLKNLDYIKISKEEMREFKEKYPEYFI